MKTEETGKYEAMIVLNLQGEEELDSLVNTVKNEMEEEGAKMSNIEKMGKKEFAYNARKQASGFFVNYFFNAGPETIEKIQARLRLNSEVYLQYYQKLSA